MFHVKPKGQLFYFCDNNIIIMVIYIKMKTVE